MRTYKLVMRGLLNRGPLRIPMEVRPIHKNLASQGFDLATSLFSMGGIPRSIGDFPEV